MSKEITRSLLIECAGLYVPLIFTAILIWWRGMERRALVAIVFCTMWQLAMLPFIDMYCQHCGYWRFNGGVVIAWKMPLSLYLGWSILWGVVVPICYGALRHKWSCAVAGAALLVGAFLLDIVLMPHLSPILILQDGWLWGEVILLGICLCPCLILYEVTYRRIYPLVRGLMIALSFVLIVLVVLPYSTKGIVIYQPRWLVALLVAGIIAALLPGFLAVWVFATKGDGTPIPFDPPVKLVTEGIYRWVANPMQLSIMLAMILSAILFHHLGLAIASVSVWAYSQSLALWSESMDLTERYGEKWTTYSAVTRRWLPRRPQKISGER